ncbi:MAG: hypothetical protein M1813_003702 [Trichoglossum hirsutum]|nr:MAG: hypothetical protein M1813_003702 [Trichoglossum hirsutum]
MALPPPSLGSSSSSSKQVFAHLLIGNTAGYTLDDWINDITQAQAARIDGFALNVGPQDSYTDNSLTNAYTAAEQRNFKLFISFDYLSAGPWSSPQVIQKIKSFADSPAQFKVDGKPLVSTFEGVSSAGDWSAIKAAVPIYFVPDWSSVGPGGFSQYLSDVDGAFSWDAWPEGANDMTDVQDKAWKSTLGSKPYMMGVSPWFYTSLPQWKKNWIWRGDSLWHDRWQQVLEVQPEFVEIITWNDYGESHYIGPIRSGGIPTGAQRYVDNMPHDSWRTVLPYYIDAYKCGNTSLPNIPQDKLVFWYRINPSKAGSTGGTTGNNPDYQPALDPAVVAQDKIFIDAIVTAPADVTVQIGSNPPTTVKATSAGVNFLAVPFNGQTGDSVTFKIVRDGNTVVTATGNGITNSCEEGIVNYNAWVGES